MLGEYLKELRVKHNLSQRALADKSGVSNAEISRIESGERKRPSEDVLRALAVSFGIDEIEFLEKFSRIRYNLVFGDGEIEKTDLQLYRDDCEDKFLSIITPKLIKNDFNVSFVKKHFLGSIMAVNENYIWRIKFIAIPEDRCMMGSRYAIESYGYLACYDELNISKFTIATNNERVFKQLIKKNPINLNIDISIMLVDLENSIIIEEHEFKNEKNILD